MEATLEGPTTSYLGYEVSAVLWGFCPNRFLFRGMIFSGAKRRGLTDRGCGEMRYQCPHRLQCPCTAPAVLHPGASAHAQAAAQSDTF